MTLVRSVKPGSESKFARHQTAGHEDRDVFRQVRFGHLGVFHAALQRHGIGRHRLAKRRGGPPASHSAAHRPRRFLPPAWLRSDWRKAVVVEVLQRVEGLRRKRTHQPVRSRGASLTKVSRIVPASGKVERVDIRHLRIGPVLVEQLGVGGLAWIRPVDHRGIACRFDFHQHGVFFIR